MLPAHHTGKIRHHRHTSYGALAAALLLTFVPLVLASRSIALAAADPVTLDNSVYAVVSAPAPTTAPVISSVASGAVYTDNSPLTVAGTCPSDTLIKVYKNDVLAGATLCRNGRFSVQIDLFLGANTLIVRAYNATNNMGPESAPVTVRKDLPGLSLIDLGQQFFVTSDIYYKGVGVGESLSWPLTIRGGQAPYAISIAWGDRRTDLISKGIVGNFDIQHTYQKPGDGYKGSYDVTITATDAAGNKSFIHLVSIVSGDKASVVGGIKQGYNWSGTIRVAWQLMLVAVLLLLAFWLGERREIHILNYRVKTA